MKFDKEILQELAWMEVGETSKWDGYEHSFKVVHKEHVSEGRWSQYYEQVFSLGDKFYMTEFSKGSTENQDERPYEYDEKLIECVEVVPREKVIIEYVAKEVEGK